MVSPWAPTTVVPAGVWGSRAAVIAVPSDVRAGWVRRGGGAACRRGAGSAGGGAARSGRPVPGWSVTSRWWGRRSRVVVGSSFSVMVGSSICSLRTCSSTVCSSVTVSVPRLTRSTGTVSLLTTGRSACRVISCSASVMSAPDSAWSRLASVMGSRVTLTSSWLTGTVLDTSSVTTYLRSRALPVSVFSTPTCSCSSERVIARRCWSGGVAALTGRTGPVGALLRRGVVLPAGLLGRGLAAVGYAVVFEQFGFLGMGEILVGVVARSGVELVRCRRAPTVRCRRSRRGPAGPATPGCRTRRI